MRLALVITALFLGAGAAAEERVHPALEEASLQFEALLAKEQPEATVLMEGGRLHARYRTRTFLVHSSMKTGEHAVKPRKVEGPDHKGFRLELSVEGPRFAELTAMVYPQTMREPYWSTHYRLYPLRDRSGFLKLRLSYGSRSDLELVRRMADLLARKPVRPNVGAQWQVRVVLKPRYVEGEPIPIHLEVERGDATARAGIPGEVTAIRIHCLEENPKHIYLGAPRLGSLLLHYPGPLPSLDRLRDITSGLWSSRGDRGFRPKPGKYELSVSYTIRFDSDVHPMNRGYTGRRQLGAETAPVTFEVVAAPASK